MNGFKTMIATMALVVSPALALAQSAAPPSAVANPAAAQTAAPTGAPAPAIVTDATQGPAVAAVPGPVPPKGVGTDPVAPAIGQASANVPSSNDPAAAAIPQALPTPGIGLPDGRAGLQDQVTEVGQDAAWMHDIVLMPVITIITLFVLALLVWVVFRYRRAANPTPSRTSHNTWLEVFWTLAPVVILLIIAVPSIRLLAKQYSPPPADLTVKVIGNQWYWTYQYPDNGDFELVSNMLKEPGQVTGGQRARTDADGPRLLAVDERMVVPAGAVVKLIVTSADVIHSFAVPAFWTKMDAVPGRLNETWFKVDRPGVYYGQCSELCGARHAFMPIAVEVVTRPQFAAWIASKGGTMPGARGAANPDATSATSPATAAVPTPTADAAIAGRGAGGSDTPIDATVTAQPVAQAATANEGTQAK
ncbi:cytochrome c oxidase subunit II [Sphingomonas montana]|uniref:cytochrome c oxidase subunit II n=1 Tax=Sphingomonas montana TaxID=1843236 RepID=UPI0009FAEF9A|nr:cytochrome c oxidase subunit II [Sphingomonas montana]